jgi:hypothetical protein
MSCSVPNRTKRILFVSMMGGPQERIPPMHRQAGSRGMGTSFPPLPSRIPCGSSTKSTCDSHWCGCTAPCRQWRCPAGAGQNDNTCGQTMKDCMQNLPPTSVCLSICLSLSDSPSVCPSACLPVCPSVRLFIHSFINLSMHTCTFCSAGTRTWSRMWPPSTTASMPLSSWVALIRRDTALWNAHRKF